MSNQAEKARLLIQALRDANQRVREAEQENRDTKAKIMDLYRTAVSLKVEAAKAPVSGETADYPRITTEDLAEMRPVQLVTNLGMMFTAVGRNLISVRADYREVTAGLEDADSALEEWQNIRIGGSGRDVASGFRDHAAKNNTLARPETPEPALARPSINRLPPVSTQMPLSPPNSVGTGGSQSVEKPKSPTPVARPQQKSTPDTKKQAPAGQPGAKQLKK